MFRVSYLLGMSVIAAKPAQLSGYTRGDKHQSHEPGSAPYGHLNHLVLAGIQVSIAGESSRKS